MDSYLQIIFESDSNSGTYLILEFLTKRIAIFYKISSFVTQFKIILSLKFIIFEKIFFHL